MFAFDTHLHFDPEDQPGLILTAARAAGVHEFLVAGTALMDSRRAQALAAAESGVYATAGVHPHEARLFDGDLTPFRRLLEQPRVLAVGEIGLDYHYNHSPPDVQRRVFAQFLELALELDRPAIIHCRDAYGDMLPRLEDAARAGLRAVIHSFTGTAAEVERLLPLGIYFGFNGMVTFTKADNIRAALAVVPLERLLAETDAPWLAPLPFRGARNQPAYVMHVIERLARERGLSVAEMTDQTTRNAHTFLRLEN